MMELVDMPGMSAQFRICRMRTANSKKVTGTLNCPFCAPKLRVPEIWFGDVFCMRGGPFRKNSTQPPQRRQVHDTAAGVFVSADKYALVNAFADEATITVNEATEWQRETSADCAAQTFVEYVIADKATQL